MFLASLKIEFSDLDIPRIRDPENRDLPEIIDGNLLGFH